MDFRLATARDLLPARVFLTAVLVTLARDLTGGVMTLTFGRAAAFALAVLVFTAVRLAVLAFDGREVLRGGLPLFVVVLAMIAFLPRVLSRSVSSNAARYDPVLRSSSACCKGK